MKSNRLRPTSGSRLCAQNSRILGSSALILRGGEHPRQQLAMHVVDRWVLEKNHRARRDFDVGLDQLDDRAACRAERLVVDQCLGNVVEAAQRVEVELLVVIERCFFAQTGERRVRIGIDLDVVGNEIRFSYGILRGGALSADRHGVPLAGPVLRKTTGCNLSHNCGIATKSVNGRLVSGNQSSPRRRTIFSFAGGGLESAA